MERIKSIKALLLADAREEAIHYVTSELEALIKKYSKPHSSEDLSKDYSFLTKILHFEIEVIFDSESLSPYRDIFRAYDPIIKELLWHLDDKTEPNPLSREVSKEIMAKVQLFDASAGGI